MKRLIITADDFGYSLAVNAAVEEAHQRGVLTTASLMVGARQTTDAVNRARRMPSLRIGLHLVLANGAPVSNPSAVPHLLDSHGEFSNDLFRAGVNYFFRAGVRRELEREIRAQFQSFQATGLSFDHVNCHNHMHLHPTIGKLMLRVGRDYGLKAVRYPFEPVLPSWRASGKGLSGKMASRVFLRPWQDLLKSQISRAGMRSNQFLFGMNDSGNMGLDLVLRFLKHLPSGVSEIYFHPAMAPIPEKDRAVPHYRYEDEFAALTSPALRRAIADSNIQCISFSDLQAIGHG